jgi:hypothetical protein
MRKTIKDKQRRKGIQAKEPGEIVQIDSLDLNKNGIKRYLYIIIEEQVSPRNIKRSKGVQTDKGLEFYKHLQMLDKVSKVL